jgi:methionyl-tRNA formyltransferase
MLVAREQDERLATTAPMLSKKDGLIDWRKSAVEIERRVRGLDPWPGSYTFAGGRALKVHRVQLLPGAVKEQAGTVVRAEPAGFWVATGAGMVGLDEVQLENKKKLPASEFIKGARIKAGDRLG